MKILRYLFYRFYQLMISVGNGSEAEYYAIFIMTMTIWMNIFTIQAILYLLEYKIVLELDTKPKIAFVYFLFVIPLYFAFVYKKKYLEIAKNYEAESDKDKTMGKVIVIGYFILSFILLFFTVYLMMMKNRGEL